MRARKKLHPQMTTVYRCELERCPTGGGPLIPCSYHSGHKTVQTLTTVLEIAYQPKRCADITCRGRQMVLRSAGWQQIAPRQSTYGYDVIAHIGWQRQSYGQTFQQVHLQLTGMVQICESQVRYLYHQRYLPLLACQERVRWDELRQVSASLGLILTLDGLMPEGGEPQLWLVRELRTGLTLRSGWLSRQDQATFEHFLQPIVERGLCVKVVLSDKQKGLLPAVGTVFPEAKHAFCQSHRFQRQQPGRTGGSSRSSHEGHLAQGGAPGDRSSVAPGTGGESWRVDGDQDASLPAGGRASGQ